MKRIFSQTIFLYFLLSFSSCSKLELSCECSSDETRVSILDVYDVITMSNKSALFDDVEFDVDPYINAKGDTLMYIVNYAKGGWKIFSSDKRTPPIIAESDLGCFSLDKGSPALKLWMKKTACDIERVKNAKDSDLNFSEFDIAVHKSFWSGNSVCYSRPDPIFASGHWEETITPVEQDYDELDHLVAKWDQWYPYNEYCPYCLLQSDRRACAGCVAISGASVLLFLHDRFGVPAEMCSSCSIRGNILNFTREWGESTSEIWDGMNYGFQNIPYRGLPEAVLIARVGECLNMHYCEVGTKLFSWALPNNLIDFYSDYGIECYSDDYNESIVRSSLLSGMPVIVCASNYMIPVEGDIHCFVIDGYKRKRIEYIHEHQFVIDEGSTGMYPLESYYRTFSYSSPYLSGIKINWGWRDQWTDGVNDGWFSLTADWAVDTGATYNYNVRMFYGFTVAQ